MNVANPETGTLPSKRRGRRKGSKPNRVVTSYPASGLVDLDGVTWVLPVKC